MLYNKQVLKLKKKPLKVQDKLSEKNASHCRAAQAFAFPRHPWPSSAWEQHSGCDVNLDVVFQGLLILGYSTFVPGTPLPSQISLPDCCDLQNCVRGTNRLIITSSVCHPMGCKGSCRHHGLGWGLLPRLAWLFLPLVGWDTEAERGAVTHPWAGGRSPYPSKAGHKSPGELTSCWASLLLHGLLMLSWEAPQDLWLLLMIYGSSHSAHDVPATFTRQLKQAKPAATRSLSYKEIKQRYKTVSCSQNQIELVQLILPHISLLLR